MAGLKDWWGEDEEEDVTEAEFDRMWNEAEFAELADRMSVRPSEFKAAMQRVHDVVAAAEQKIREDAEEALKQSTKKYQHVQISQGMFVSSGTEGFITYNRGDFVTGTIRLKDVSEDGLTIRNNYLGS